MHFRAGSVEHSRQRAVGIEKRRAGAAQRFVARPEMLALMNRDRTLLGDAGTDAVGAFGILGPQPAEPRAKPQSSNCSKK